jgi:hypothetical protein
MMIRLIATGACALFLVGCTATENPPAGNPPANAVATDASTRFELGKPV